MDGWIDRWTGWVGRWLDGYMDGQACGLVGGNGWVMVHAMLT